MIASTVSSAQNKVKPKKTPMPASKSVSQVAPSGLLYKISGNKLAKPSYIFGTIHIICPNDLFGMEKLTEYFNQTERLFLELDMDNAEVMGKAANALNMPEGKTLKNYLMPEKYAKVDEMFKNVVGVPVEALSRFNPSALALIIGTSPKATGCAVPDSYELKFVKLATESKKSVEGLETVEDQIAAFNKIPLEKQAEDLYKMSLDPQKSLDKFKELLATYKLQDSEKLGKYVALQSTEDPQFAARLLDERNKNWIPKIEKAVAEQSTFFAVGGAHLGGQNGVVNLLRKNGYTVTAIKF